MKYLNNKFLFAVLFVFSFQTEAALYKFKGIVDVVNGKLFPEQFVEINNDKIVKLLDHVSSKEKVHDFSQLYLSPGLIDAHSHVFVSQMAPDKNFSDALMREDKLSKVQRSKRAKKYLQQYVMEGFTSLFDLGNSGHFLDVEMRNETKRNAQFPLMFVSGPGLAVYPGQFPATATHAQVSKEYAIVDSKTNIGNLLKTYADKKVDILKIYLDNFPGPGALDENILKKILNDPNIGNFKKVTFHSFIPKSGELLRKYQIRNTEHFNFYMGEDFPKTLSFISPTNFDIETMKQFNQYSASYYLLQQNVLKRLYKDKIKILFGPDFYYEDPKDQEFNRAKIVKRTMRSFIDAGIDPKEILKMMTYNPALSIGMQNSIGQICPGSYANLIGTKENPLLETTAFFNLSLIMNKGQIVLSK